MQAADGSLYGTTAGGGANGFGTVFRVTAPGSLTTLHSFNDTDGAGPLSGVIQGIDGNFYGTAWEGGALDCAYFNYFSGCGTLFKMTPDGSTTPGYTFCVVPSQCSDGSNPVGGLVQAVDGSFYGTTQYGGTDGFSYCDYIACGTLFSITSSGKLSTLYLFCSDPFDCSDGFYPSTALVQGTDGNIYGTTGYGGSSSDLCACGTIFSITPAGKLKTLYSFSGTNDGSTPGPLLLSTNGTFYGTTTAGGSGGYGTIYSLSTGLPAFVTASPAIGRVGEKVLITGTNLKGTTAVTFNRTTAQFTVVSKTLIIATVPVGATSGFILVTTPGGKLSSNAAFRVIP
jgi:uncharacterized repeat protein (TIGR03803 family)